MAIINLLNNRAENQATLSAIYQMARREISPTYYFPKTGSIWVDQKKKKYEFSHELLYCQELDAFLVLYDIPLDKGSVGEIKRNIGLIKSVNNKFVYLEDESYVVKIINDFNIDCENEVHFSQHISYLAMRSVIWVNATRYFIMNRIKGENLYYFILNKKIDKFSDEEKIKFVIKLLNQIKEKIHQEKIVHLDIKTKNIIVTEKNNYLFPRVIDFGISVLQDECESLDECRGTPGYLQADMVKKHKSGIFSDISSLGVLIAEIFGHVISDDERRKNRDGLTTDREFNLKFKESELSDLQKKMVSDIVSNMANIGSDQAGTLDNAIIIFNELRLQLKFKNISEEFHASVIHASDVAIDIREEIRRPDCSPRQLQVAINQGLISVDDNPDALAEFIEVLNIKALSGCKSKLEIKTLTNKIFKEYNIEKINKMFIEKSVLEELISFDLSCEVNDLLSMHLNKNRQALSDLKIFPAKLDNIIKVKDKLNAYQFVSLTSLPETMPHMLTNIFNIKVRVANLSLEYEENTLRSQVVKSIESYLNETLMRTTILRQDRSASPERLRDMRDILNLVQSDLSDNELIIKLNGRLNCREFSLGFFGKWGSSLRSGVLEVVKIYQKEASLLRMP